MLLWVGLFEHLNVSSAVCHHLDEAAAGVVVFLVLLEVIGKLVDFLGEHSNLHLFRARVRCVDLVLLNDALLFLGR